MYRRYIKRGHKIKNTPYSIRKVDSVIRRGVKKGDSTQKIAKELEKVKGVTKSNKMMVARTGATYFENLGRQEMFEESEAMGIPMTKQWLATGDARTRDSHREMDGEEVGIKEEFSNGLEEPCDPSGDPAEVCNCRCTMIGNVHETAEPTRNQYGGWVEALTVAAGAYMAYKATEDEEIEE